MRSLATLAFLLVAGTAALEQPSKHGCHYFRNQAPKRAALSAGQLKAINASIARSDTFDIVHYDIAIDVTDYDGQSREFLGSSATRCASAFGARLTWAQTSEKR